MRRAQAADWRRRLAKGAGGWKTRLSRFAFAASPGLGDGELGFLHPVTLITGPNGAGKSSLLRSIWGALDPNAAGQALVADRKLAGARLEIEGDYEGEPFSFKMAIGAADQAVPEIQLQVTFVDCARDPIKYRDAFNNFLDTEELLNGVAGVEVRSDQIAELSAIVRRDYRSIRVYEVELDGFAPFFEVTHGSSSYDSRSMGDGEISAFHIWWSLSRAEHDSIICVEEPEVFLSHMCQIELTNFICKIAVEKRLCMVIGTHCAALILAVPDASVQFISRTGTGVEILGGRAPPAVLASVGIRPHICAVVYVEDSAAAAFLRSLLEKFDPKFARSISIVSRGGDGEVSTAILSANKLGLPIKTTGMFDGDMKGRVAAEVEPNSGFLPGDVAIELIFKRVALDNVGELSRRLGNDRVAATLAALEGIDHHDWFEELASGLGLLKANLFMILFELWFADEANADLAKVCYERLVEVCDLP